MIEKTDEKYLMRQNPSHSVSANNRNKLINQVLSS